MDNTSMFNFQGRKRKPMGYGTSEGAEVGMPADAGKAPSQPGMGVGDYAMDALGGFQRGGLAGAGATLLIDLLKKRKGGR